MTDHQKFALEREKLALDYQKVRLEREKFAHSRWWQEDNLVHQRLSLLLHSQVILFAAYGLVAKLFTGEGRGTQSEQVADHLHMLPLLGASICLFVAFGIHAAWRAQEILQSMYNPDGIELGVHKITTLGGRLLGRCLPYLFSAGWGWLLKQWATAILFPVVTFLLVEAVNRWFVKQSGGAE
jgi:hypothetical protein